VSEEGLKRAEKRREAKGKPSSVNNVKKYMKIIEWGRLKISSRKLEIPKELCTQRWAQ